MKGSNLDTQIANLRKFVEIRNKIAQQDGGNYCSVTLQLTFMEVNLEELPELVKFAIEEDCDRVSLRSHDATFRTNSLPASVSTPSQSSTTQSQSVGSQNSIDVL